MGFPVAYTDIILPNLLLHLLTFLGLFRNLIASFFRSIGLPNFLEPDSSSYTTHQHHHHHSHDPYPSVSAVLIREILPIAKFSDLANPPESCAVCLYEFQHTDEIRTLTNCSHIFHRSCVDRWMDHDHKTCPLCRTHFIPDEMRDDFNQRLWAATGISDFYQESSPITSF